MIEEIHEIVFDSNCSLDNSWSKYLFKHLIMYFLK